jgi:hypothetical protein
MPLSTSTVPLLLNGPLKRVMPSPPPVLVNVPALLNVALKKSPVVWIARLPVTRLLNTAPVSLLKLPTPVQVAVPALLNVRVSRKETPLASVSCTPPLALVVPWLVIVPPLQVSSPVTLTVSLPARVPLLCW